jgi:hypothetical protein
MDAPFIYITRGQMPEDFEVKRKAWHRSKHAPDVVGLGFLSARAYSGQAFPQNCNVYEIADLNLFEDPAYMAMRKADTFIPTVMDKFSYHSATFYKQTVVLDGDGSPIREVPTLSGRALSLLYIDFVGDLVPPDWFRNSIRKLDKTSARTFRMWERTRQHPLEPPKESRWCAAIEWEVADPSDPLRLEGAAREESETNVIRSELVVKWYGLLQESAFEG